MLRGTGVGIGVGVGVGVAVGVGVGVLVGVGVGVKRIDTRGSGRGKITRDRASPMVANTDNNMMMASNDLSLISEFFLLQPWKFC